MEFKYSLRRKDFDVRFCKETLSDSTAGVSIDISDDEGEHLDSLFLYMGKTEAKVFAESILNSIN